ncbi:MAG: RNA polymerase factor sigma-54 [Bacteroidota bacterium]
MLHLSQQMRLLQKLTPQQIQYLKLLQLPTLALEQNIKMELEANPLLEEGVEDEIELEQSDDDTPPSPEEEAAAEEKKEDDFTFEDFLNDEETYTPKGEKQSSDDEDKDEFPIAAPTPLTEKLLDQLHLADVTDMGMLVAEEIIGNIDEDGYLHRDLESIVTDINLTHKLHLTVTQVEEVLKIIQRLEPPGIGSRSLQECLLIQLEFIKPDLDPVELAKTLIREHFEQFHVKDAATVASLLHISLTDAEKVIDLLSRLHSKPGRKSEESNGDDNVHDSLAAGLSDTLLKQLRERNTSRIDLLLAQEIIHCINGNGYFRGDLAIIVDNLNSMHHLQLTVDAAESMLRTIQQLEPKGIGARSAKESILIQLESLPPALDRVAVARKLLSEHFDEFTKKHYEQISKLMLIPLDDVKRVLDLISHLNPKPGEGTITAQENYLVPDFIVTKDENNFVIQLNDKNIPPLRINRNYRELMSKRNKATSAETKQFLKQKFDSAKWFIASIYQRRETMLKVMHAIVDRQRDFFETGEGLKPLIYKDIAETIRMDISTISRVVNGKYVQTDFGVYELRHFFSEGISTQSGEDVSNKEVKERIKEILATEDKSKPLSDEEIASILKEKGFNIARRTVAKYRESMMIPVARLRRSI